MAASPYGGRIYFNGEFVPAEQARVHVLTPAFRYGAMVFEGLRAYWNPEAQRLYVFRLLDHARRLHDSMKMMRMEPLFTPEELAEQVVTALRGLGVREDVHIRQMVYVDGDGPVWSRGPVGFAVSVHAAGRPEGFDAGIRCCVSSWLRISDQNLPPRIKCAANYQNSRLAALQARHDGYDAPILLNAAGKVTESWGACVMLVRGGKLVTPPTTAGILESVTRDTVLTLARQLGIECEERDVDRTELYIASEVFLCGSAFELTPVRAIDGLPIGNGERGAVTARLQQRYLDVARGYDEAHSAWCYSVF